MNILIIGAGPGLSRSVSNLFGQKGFNVSLVARNEQKLQQEIKELEAKNIKANYKVLDACDENSFTAFLENLKSSESFPDVILYNAFAYTQNGIENETWDSLKNQLDVNVGAAFSVLKTTLPIMMKNNYGKLFFTGGGFGIDPSPDLIGLSMGKAALRNLVHAAAKNVAGSNVHVATLTVCGFIGGSDSKYAPDEIAKRYWELFEQTQENFEVEIQY